MGGFGDPGAGKSSEIFDGKNVTSYVAFPSKFSETVHGHCMLAFPQNDGIFLLVGGKSNDDFLKYNMYSFNLNTSDWNKMSTTLLEARRMHLVFYEKENHSLVAQWQYRILKDVDSCNV